MRHTITLDLTREQADWLLLKTKKHLRVYEQNVQHIEARGFALSEKWYAECEDVNQARAIVNLLLTQLDGGVA